jgi:hypothetical protein
MTWAEALRVVIALATDLGDHGAPEVGAVSAQALINTAQITDKIARRDFDGMTPLPPMHDFKRFQG